MIFSKFVNKLFSLSNVTFIFNKLRGQKSTVFSSVLGIRCRSLVVVWGSPDIFPGIVLLYDSCPSITVHTSFCSQKCLALNDDLFVLSSKCPCWWSHRQTSFGQNRSPSAALCLEASTLVSGVPVAELAELPGFSPQSSVPWAELSLSCGQGWREGCRARGHRGQSKKEQGHLWQEQVPSHEQPSVPWLPSGRDESTSVRPGRPTTSACFRAFQGTEGHYCVLAPVFPTPGGDYLPELLCNFLSLPGASDPCAFNQNHGGHGGDSRKGNRARDRKSMETML